MNSNNIENELLKRGFERSKGTDFWSKKVNDDIEITITDANERQKFLIIITKLPDVKSLPVIQTIESFLLQEIDETIEFFS